MTGAAAIPRCAICGAEQPPYASEGEGCDECGRILGFAPPPVARGPSGWCPHHPDSPVTGVCARCGVFTCTDCDVSVGGIRYCTRCRVRQRKAFTAPVAWEERTRLGRFRAWYRTTTQVTGQPGTFFERLDPEAGIGGALVFALIGACLLQSGQAAVRLMGLLATALTLVTQVVLDPQAPGTVAMAVGMLGKVVTLLVSPLALLLLYLTVAALQHLALRIVDAGGERGIGATIKVGCYAFALGWLGIVPWLGHLAFPIWWTVVMVIGTARVHHRSTTRTLVVVLPTALLLLAPVAACVVGVLLGAFAV